MYSQNSPTYFMNEETVIALSSSSISESKSRGDRFPKTGDSKVLRICICVRLAKQYEHEYGRGIKLDRLIPLERQSLERIINYAVATVHLGATIRGIRSRWARNTRWTQST